MSGIPIILWLLGGYMWLFIHRPFEVWPSLGAWHLEKVYMVVTILYWAVFAEKRLVRNRLNWRFGFFWIVVLVSWLWSRYGSEGAPAVEDYFKIVVFYVLVMTTARTERHLRFLVGAFLVAMTLYMAHSLREYHCGRVAYAMGTDRMIGVDQMYGGANEFAIALVCALSMVLPVWHACRAAWQRGAVVAYVLLSVTCILLTSSRTGFACLCCLVGLVTLFSKYRFRAIAIVALAGPVFWICLPQDRQNRYLTFVDPSYGPANAQQSAEARTRFWWMCVDVWEKNPVLGAGPGAFGPASGINRPPHHLYGQVLAELGTVGAVAFGGIVLALLANYRDLRRKRRNAAGPLRGFPCRVVEAATLTTVVLLLAGLAEHLLFHYPWLWFGAFQAIALFQLEQNEEDVCASKESDNRD